MNNKQAGTSKPADELVGKYLLIGITYLDHKNREIESKELHGRITNIGKTTISVTLEGIHKGELYEIPYTPTSLSQAEPGIYELKSTKEVIENPDLVTNWNVYKNKTIFLKAHPRIKPDGFRIR